MHAEPECLLLDATGAGHLFGGDHGLVQKVVGDLAARRLTCRAAMANTVGMAWGVAHFGGMDAPSAASLRDRWITEANPWGIVVLPDQDRTLLGTLPVAALRLADETLNLLAQLGIERVDQLAGLPRAGLISRLGEGVAEQLDRALGTRRETITPLDPPPRLEAARILEPPIVDTAAALQVLRDLTGSILEDLNAGWGIRQLDVTLTHETEPTSIQIVFSRPTASADHVSALARLQFERHCWPGPVTRLHVAATSTSPIEWVQEELFEEEDRKATRREIPLLIDRLSSRLGREQVCRALPVPDAQPERAFRSIPAQEPLGKTPDTLAASLIRPFRLLTPEPVEVLAVAPNGPPRRLRWGKMTQEVARAWGPERIETGWWRGRRIYRDYFRVRLAGGERLWLFHDLQRRAWFLHGIFD